MVIPSKDKLPTALRLTTCRGSLVVPAPRAVMMAGFAPEAAAAATMTVAPSLHGHRALRRRAGPSLGASDIISACLHGPARSFDLHGVHRPLLVARSHAPVIAGLPPQNAFGRVDLKGHVHLLGPDDGIFSE